MLLKIKKPRKGACSDHFLLTFKLDSIDYLEKASGQGPRYLGPDG